MGYDTTFKGELKFAKELTASQLAKVSSFLGEDCREHPEWEVDPKLELDYIDLEFLDDFSGLRWNGAEKTYQLDHKINLIIREMRRTIPDFRLTGELFAFGNEPGNFWVLDFDENGWAVKKEKDVFKNTCPHCGKEI